MKLIEIILTYGKKHFMDKEFTDSNVSEKFLHEIHPKQIVCRFDSQPFMFYKIKYKYTTNKGNVKEGTKYFIFNTFSPEVDTKTELGKWIKEFNKDNPERQLSNVKFLESNCLGYSVIE